MKTFEEFEEEQKYRTLYEGIDIDLSSKTVKLNNSHENGVNTSIEDNPTITDKAISVFKRNKLASPIGDGNPLVYALKHTNGWNISNVDREEIMNRVSKILKKVEYDFDVVILAPSSSGLILEFADIIEATFNKTIHRSCFVKRTVEEVYANMDWSLYTQDEREIIQDRMVKMGTYFQAKYFPKEMANRLETGIFKFDPNISGLEIDNKKVLVVDDILSSGMTLSHCAKILKESYFPESVFNLVLFGEL